MATYNRKDRLYQQAKEEGYRSRAAYKLLELDEKLRFFRPGLSVLDLGSFPGGWLQIAAQRVGPKGRVVGIDLKEIAPFRPEEIGNGAPSPIVFRGDIADSALQSEIVKTAGNRFDIVLCDMSPNLSGVQDRDQVRMAELLRCALELTPVFLKIKGNFVAKTFPGVEIDEICRDYRKYFEKLDRTRLKSSRNTSNEQYLVGRSFRGPNESTSGKHVTSPPQ